MTNGDHTYYNIIRVYTKYKTKYVFVSVKWTYTSQRCCYDNILVKSFILNSTHISLKWWQYAMILFCIYKTSERFRTDKLIWAKIKVAFILNGFFGIMHVHNEVWNHDLSVVNETWKLRDDDNDKIIIILDIYYEATLLYGLYTLPSDEWNVLK